MNPLDAARAAATETVEVSAAIVRRELRGALATVRVILEDAATKVKGYDLDEVTFSIGLEASGKVSLLSVASANTSASAGIQFTFRRSDAK